MHHRVVSNGNLRFPFQVLLSLLIICVFLFSGCATPPTPLSVKEAAARATRASARWPGAVLADSADKNAATALLYRWWGLFEAPPGVDRTPWITHILAEDVQIQIQGLDLKGLAQARAALSQRPPTDQIAHRANAIEVYALGNGNYAINVEFIFQSQPKDGPLRGGHAAYHHEMRKREDGSLVFTKIAGEFGGGIDLLEFQSTYAENRARAAIIQFQAVVDRLDGNGEGFREITKRDVVLRNLLGEPDDSAEGDVDLDDWNNEIQGHTGLEDWISAGPSVFQRMSHELEDFQFRIRKDGRSEAAATFLWQAKSISGESFEKRNPRTWILDDQGGKYALIAESH